MTFHFNLYRFGVDEFAVGHLINGDFPDDDEERWQIVEAPRYHIGRLLDEHLRAQATLRDCLESGRPFVLYLRSFAAEQNTTREGQSVASHVSFTSVNFQRWVQEQMGPEAAPLVRLHGGSDGFYPGTGEDAMVLSTHAANWKGVVEEMVRAASAIVFLASHLTEGVREEFEVIRGAGQTGRCFVVMLDASGTPSRDSGGATPARADLADFPHVFELRQGPTAAETVYPKELAPALTGLLRGAKTEAPLEQAIAAQFTYLEPSFTESEEYAQTQRYVWASLRALRVMFEDTYWAALKSRGINFRHFTFPGPWKVTHQVYGLAIATADFRAVRESLRYLYLLYVFRGADFALVLPVLSGQYDELAARIYGGEPPETESRFTNGTDPLSLPASVGVAVELFKYADAAARRQDAETANYLYQAAVICALRVTEDDERDVIVANLCGEWAKFQGGVGQSEWAVTNHQFSISLFRELAAADPGLYKGDLALALNNFGSLLYRRGEMPEAEASFVEALEIRRALPRESENYLANLYHSLANLGLARAGLGQFEAARSLYGEAIEVCEERAGSEPESLADLTRVQGWMSLCLAKIPGAKPLGLEYARRADEKLEQVARISPESAAALRELVGEAVRVNDATT